MPAPGANKETFLVIAAGVLVVLLFDATIAGIVNPLLTPLRLSYT